MYSWGRLYQATNKEVLNCFKSLLNGITMRVDKPAIILNIQWGWGKCLGEVSSHVKTIFDPYYNLSVSSAKQNTPILNSQSLLNKQRACCEWIAVPVLIAVPFVWMSYYTRVFLPLKFVSFSFNLKDFYEIPRNIVLE